MDPSFEVAQEFNGESNLAPPAPGVSLTQQMMGERIDADTRRTIDRMLFRDTVMTLSFLTLLWISYGIVSIVIRPIIASPAVYMLFLACIALVTLYNTVSLLAMVRNMRRDRLFIYIRDILHLRDARRTAVQGNKGRQADAVDLVMAATTDKEG